MGAKHKNLSDYTGYRFMKLFLICEHTNNPIWIGNCIKAFPSSSEDKVYK